MARKSTVAEPALVLASGSRRRLDLLREAGFEPIVVSPDIDESPIADEKPDEFVCRMAKEKAEVVVPDYPSAMVVAADTIIALDDEIIGKPIDREDAVAILNKLSGQRHQVMTGVCLYRRQPIFLHCWYVTASVTFRDLNDAEIDAYLEVANWQDKAGAYAIQEHGGEFVAEFSGLRSTIVGLPIEQVAERLELSVPRRLPS